MATDLNQIAQPNATERAPWLAGVVPPVCTPLTDELEVDQASLERLIGTLLEGGVSGLFMLGSSSEGAFFRQDQRDLVIEVAVKCAGGQVPVIAGAIDTATARVCESAQRAVALGVDGIVVTAPFYALSTRPDELERHFRTIKAATNSRLLAYDIPVSVNCKLPPHVMAELALEGVVDGIKDSSGDIAAMRELVMATRALSEFTILTGSQVIVDCAILAGADGVVPGLGNVDPAAYVDLCRACAQQDWSRARLIQERLCRLFRITRCADARIHGPTAAGLGAFKTALQLRGIFTTNALALPQQALDAAESSAVRGILEEMDLL